MKYKRIIAFLLALVLTVSGSITAFAAADELRYFQRGVLTDGTNTAYWIIDKDNKILYLSGDGVSNANTPDYPSADQGPFAGRTDVTRVVIEEDVNYVGAYVFANMKSVDTIEIQSNLLKRENSINENAFSGDTGIRNVQGDSEVLSTNTLINAVKVGIGVFTGDWLSVVKNVINTGSDVMANDGTLDDTSVDAMVNDYITNGETVFIGDMNEVISGYEERTSNPCYINNAFSHTYSSETTKQPSCTEDGEITKTCSVCGDVSIDYIPATGHSYVDEVFSEPTCTRRGVMERYCTVCGDSSFTAIPALGHTEVVIPAVPSSCTATGLTQGSYCSVCGETVTEQQVTAMLPHNDSYVYTSSTDSYKAVCGSCSREVTSFDNDISALVEAEQLYSSLIPEDYSEESFGELYSVAELHKYISEGDSLQYPQFAIDREVSDILTKLSMLEPYLNLQLEGEGCSATVADSDGTRGEGSGRVLFGDYVTFTAQTDSDHRFIAWYDVNTKRYLSTETTFSYTVTSNLYIKAIAVDKTCSTLTFRGEGGQVIESISKTASDWLEVEDYEAFFPKVPYKYGYTNGRWVYTERNFIDLENGYNIDIYPEYDAVDVQLPELPALADLTVPSLSLTYVYDGSNNESVGTFIMASNVSTSCRIETIGIAYIKLPAAEFDPTDVNLIVNNQVTTARFPGVSDSGLYILNVRNLSRKNNWAVKGYMTYLDTYGRLRIAYTNQINIVNKTAI